MMSLVSSERRRDGRTDATMNKATKKAIITEYRAAKAHLEGVLGIAPVIGLDNWLRDVVTPATVLACEVKRFYAAMGANVEADASKTLAYARMGLAWEAYQTVYV